MIDIFFYIFASITLASALMVVLSRNPVNAAMFMIVTLLGAASLFVLLEAFFLAVVQVLVYAGAVVVLFLFIVMLLEIKDNGTSKLKMPSLIASLLSLALFILGVVTITNADSAVVAEVTPLADSSMKAIGRELFTKYLLPLQVTGFMLLIAMVGVIVLSKKTPLKKDEA